MASPPPMPPYIASLTPMPPIWQVRLLRRIYGKSVSSAPCMDGMSVSGVPCLGGAVLARDVERFSCLPYLVAMGSPNIFLWLLCSPNMPIPPPKSFFRVAL